MGIKKLKFIGGEPLVFRKDLEKLIHHAQNVKIDDISIHSNGTLLNNKLCVFFKENRVHLDVTIYSHIEITHDSITNTKGSWQQTLYGLEMLSSHGVDFSIVIIVLPENEKDLIQTQRELKRRFPNVTVNFDYTRPVGRAKDIYNQLEFTHLNRFQEHYSFFQGVSEEEFLERHFFNPCLSNKVRVSENGSIFPCIMMNESAGNIANTDIKSIIDSDKFNKYRKLPLSNIEVCRDCEFRYACTDCRPIAIGLTDNVFAKPPECKYDPFMGKINHIEYKNI